MTVEIVLNTNTEIIWSLVDSAIMLTEETPKASVDIDKLTDKQKQSLRAALMLGKVNSATPIVSLLAPQQTVSPETKNGAAIQEPAENPAVRAKELLSGTVQTVKKEVLINNDIRSLKLMLALEEGAQKRATVLKVLREKIASIEKAVQASVDAATGPAIRLADPSLTIHGKKTISYDVVESRDEDRQVEIQLPGQTN